MFPSFSDKNIDTLKATIQISTDPERNQTKPEINETKSSRAKNLLQADSPPWYKKLPWLSQILLDCRLFQNCPVNAIKVHVQPDCFEETGQEGTCWGEKSLP